MPRTINLFCPSASTAVQLVAHDDQRLDIGSIARAFGLDPTTVMLNGHFISRGVDLIASSVTWKSLISFFSSRGLSTGTGGSAALVVDGKLCKSGCKRVNDSVNGITRTTDEGCNSIIRKPLFEDSNANVDSRSNSFSLKRKLEDASYSLKRLKVDESDVSNSLWNNIRENDDGLSYVLDETTTPVKSCGDLAYQVPENENANKGMETCHEVSSQSKRRRMLRFNDEVEDEDFSSNFLKYEEKVDSWDDAFADMAHWVSGFADDMSVSGSRCDGLDQSSEGWLANCLVNDSGMNFSPDDMCVSGTPDTLMHLTDSSNSQPKNDGNTVQEDHTPTRQNIIFKGKKSFIKTPTKMTSSVVLPFAFVKPCGEGAVTLKDINQKILTPPPSKSKKMYEDPTSYPMSAFSGKPIVGKTKIRTEGGKGSITIMRTRG
ncbi:hypothetical protein R6Q57_004528 [Mikania cordata]